MTVLESAQLEKCLKSEEHSCAYLVRDRESGQRRIYREFEGSGEVYRKLAQLHSAHLPQVYQVQETGERVAVVEEYIPGDTLAFLLEKGCLRRRRRTSSASSATPSRRCTRRASSTGISSRKTSSLTGTAGSC